MIPIMELSDKRVDRILFRKGYQDANLFYSPIRVWVTLFTGFAGIALLIGFVFLIGSPWILFLLLYLFIAYLLNARHCCSFALVEGKCCIINPNWPFRKFRVIELSQIESVIIDERHTKWMTLFTLFGSNYIEVKTAVGIERFYSAYLELDAFDENFTKQTIEDFQYALERLEIPVQMNLQYD
ncbi:MAG: hypothetical protein EOP54_08200 [Sphingobacteriales bacterium]|nr:MAG: hypothetical protein EOP54_08200 [Sphingobacteriales bacterium]